MVATERSIDASSIGAGDRSEWRDELGDLVVRPGWHVRAACRDVDKAVFFPTRGQSLEPARAICAMCEVQTHCLEEARRDPETRGVWAGTSLRERRRMPRV